MEASREKKLVPHAWSGVGLASDFSTVTPEEHRPQRSNEKLFLTQRSILKLSMKCEDRMKTFSDIQNLRFTSSVPFVKKLLKYVLHQHKKVNKKDDVSCKQKGDGAGSSLDEHCIPGAERSHSRLQWGSGPEEEDFTEMMELISQLFGRQYPRGWRTLPC